MNLLRGIKSPAYLAVRRWLGLSALVLVVCATVSPADAGKADGLYRPTDLSGFVRVAGQKVDLPLGKLREALLKNGVIPVRSNQIPIAVGKWPAVLENIGLFGIKGTASATGPPRIVLKPVAGGFAGRTFTPVTTKVRGKYKGFKVRVRMSTSLETKVVGDELVMDAPVKISLIGLSFSGRIRMEADKLAFPF